MITLCSHSFPQYEQRVRAKAGTLPPTLYLHPFLLAVSNPSLTLSTIKGTTIFYIVDFYSPGAYLKHMRRQRYSL